MITWISLNNSTDYEKSFKLKGGSKIILRDSLEINRLYKTKNVHVFFSLCRSFYFIFQHRGSSLISPKHLYHSLNMEARKSKFPPGSAFLCDTGDLFNGLMLGLPSDTQLARQPCGGTGYSLHGASFYIPSPVLCLSC